MRLHSYISYRPFLPFAVLAALATSLVPADAAERRVVMGSSLDAPVVMTFENAPGVRNSGVRVGTTTSRAATAPGSAAGRYAPRVMRRMAPSGPTPEVTASLRTRTELRNGFPDRYLPTTVSYDAGHRPGTIVIDTEARFLYLVESGGKARRYGVGVGKPGFEWAGKHKVTRKTEWPSWTPPQSMIMRERLNGRELPPFMEGGPANPMGARALYLGSSLYRIHGTNQPWTIGQAVSSGCIRMRNIDVTDLYERVGVGTRVVVR